LFYLFYLFIYLLNKKHTLTQNSQLEPVLEIGHVHTPVCASHPPPSHEHTLFYLIC